MWQFWKIKRWNNRRIAFVSILVATSVSFIVIASTIAPFVALPTFKVAAGGLPVKLTGYIFGPFVGFITGVLSDLISFAFRPVNFHFYYTLAFGCAGLFPGFIGYLMNRRWKYKTSAIPDIDKKKYNNINFVVTLVILLCCLLALMWTILSQPNEKFEQQKLIQNKYVFLGIVMTGSGSLFIGAIFFRFIFKPQTFNAILPLIAFSAILEIVNTPLVSIGDVKSGILPSREFLTVMTGHFLLAPVKAWGNLIIIYFSYKVIAPLIFNKSSNGWENDRREIILPKTKFQKISNIKNGKK